MAGRGEKGPAVLYEVRDGVAWITLNRPRVLNAINQAVLRGLYEALGRAAEEEEVRVVVLRGAGRAFSSGGDLMERESLVPSEEGQGDIITPEQAFFRIWDLPKPVIAAVHGYALGQGCELAGICDITVAAEGTKFGEVQIRHGFGPPIFVMPFLVGLKHAKALLLSGDTIDAREAERIGLVERVFPPKRLWEEVEALARRIASLPRGTVAMNKRLINRAYELLGLRSAVKYSSDPNYADIPTSGWLDEEGRARIRVLEEQGWEAFLRVRDALFRRDEEAGR